MTRGESHFARNQVRTSNQWGLRRKTKGIKAPAFVERMENCWHFTKMWNLTELPWYLRQKYWAADLYCSWKCGGGLEQKLIINSYIWPQNLFEDSTQFWSKLLGNVEFWRQNFKKIWIFGAKSFENFLVFAAFFFKTNIFGAKIQKL